MEKEALRLRVEEVVGNVLGYDWDDLKLGDDLREDLGMDELSFEMIEMELEEEFGVEFEEGWAVELKTFEDLQKFLNKIEV